mgnify:CR=1 FL=1
MSRSARVLPEGRHATVGRCPTGTPAKFFSLFHRSSPSLGQLGIRNMYHMYSGGVSQIGTLRSGRVVAQGVQIDLIVFITNDTFILSIDMPMASSP